MSNSSSLVSRWAEKARTIATVAFRDDYQTALARRLKNGDQITIKGLFTVTKFRSDANQYDSYQDFLRHNDPYAISQFSNGLLLTGVQAMYAQMIGTGTATANTAYATPTFYSAAQSAIGVGDSTTAFANTQTGLQATTNKAYEPMQSGYPSIGTGASANIITFQSSFAGTVGNYAWNEFVVVNSPADTLNSIALGSNAIALNRAVSSQGTKASGSTWQTTYQLTIS